MYIHSILELDNKDSDGYNLTASLDEDASADIKKRILKFVKEGKGFIHPIDNIFGTEDKNERINK